MDQASLAAYRLLWALADIAAFTIQLREPHHADADAEKTIAALRGILEGQASPPFHPCTPKEEVAFERRS